LALVFFPLFLPYCFYKQKRGKREGRKKERKEVGKKEEKEREKEGGIEGRRKRRRNGEQMKPFPLKSVMRQGYPLSQLLFNIVLEFLLRTVRQEQEIKGIPIGKKEDKLPLFTDDMILYLKDAKNSTPKLLEIIKTPLTR
jgi:hypothetical protein